MFTATSKSSREVCAIKLVSPEINVTEIYDAALGVKYLNTIRDN